MSTCLLVFQDSYEFCTQEMKALWYNMEKWFLTEVQYKLENSSVFDA